SQSLDEQLQIRVVDRPRDIGLRGSLPRQQHWLSRLRVPLLVGGGLSLREGRFGVATKTSIEGDCRADELRAIRPEHRPRWRPRALWCSMATKRRCDYERWSRILLRVSALQC
ncbi:MAG: hypothetical protein KUG67_02860, partial [Proteobacteria bacterium]|nr:hypothetical protein [Pseudomonadota bacterium]